MNVSEAIRKRRSIRKYVKCDMPENDIKMILEAGMMAPSAKNTRSWEFVVLKSNDAKQKAISIHPFAKHLENASIGIIVCANISEENVKKMGFYPQDSGAAIENMLLQSLELGYGSCWCGIYPNKERVVEFKCEFNLTSEPIALVVIGMADEEKSTRGFYDESKVSIL